MRSQGADRIIHHVQGQHPRGAIAQEMGDILQLARTRFNLAEIVRHRDALQAAQLIQEGLLDAREIGDQLGICCFLRLLGDIAQSQGNAGQAAEHYRESLPLALKLKGPRGKEAVGWCLLGLARVARTKGRVQQAARLLGAVEPRLSFNLEFDTLNTDPAERTAYERDVAEVRAQLGEEAFAALWAEGRRMTPEQVIAAPDSVTLARASTTAPAAPPAKPSTYPAGLTSREVEILRLVAQGLTDAQVAEQLIISRRTVNWHLSSIYSKLGVSSRSAATRYAIEQRLL